MYILIVDKENVDKVVLELTKYNFKIVDVFRSSGQIQVKAERKEVLEKIRYIKTIKKEGILPQLLQL